MGREKWLQFPQGFLWGTATAAYQVEGAVAEGGRGPSIWDTFCRAPGKVHHGDTGDIACDHYHRWDQDLALLASLGVNAYRFSVSWARLQPMGSGPLNPKGLDFYRRLCDRLAAAGITTMCTLYHWDLPQTLEDEGGWASRQTALRFADYAQAVVEALADGVALWATVNEPWVCAFVGHWQARHAPGKADLASALKAAHHLLLGHGLAVAATRSVLPPGAGIGAVLNLTPVAAATPSPQDTQAAEMVDAYANRWFLDPLFRATYPQDLAASFYTVTGDDHVRAEDMALISAPVDFLGVNYYVSRHVAAGTGTTPGPYPPGLAAKDVPLDAVPVTGRGWRIQPQGLTALLARIKADYGDVPVYVTENGAAYPDYVTPEGDVDDPERVAYISAHLEAAHAAVQAGVDLRGYFYWSLMDNFEWELGYSQRFGLVWVDFHTQARIPKASARWFGRVAQGNGLTTRVFD